MTTHATRSSEPRVVVERYMVRVAFHCPRCDRDWTRRYERREYRGPAGRRWIVHCRDGIPVRGPRFGSRCPRCHAVSLQMELVPGAEPEPSSFPESDRGANAG